MSYAGLTMDPVLDIGSDWIKVGQTTLAVLGGGWALYLYRSGRRGEVRVAVEPVVRLSREVRPGESILFVRLRITNASSVLFRYEQAEATLMDASTRTPSGEIVLAPLAQQDPFIPVYGEMVQESTVIQGGRLFQLWEGQRISLEPGEFVDSELAFPLSSQQLGLLAMRITVSMSKEEMG
jgi:hypothetical protein